jgi:hypothetical protein
MRRTSQGRTALREAGTAPATVADGVVAVDGTVPYPPDVSVLEAMVADSGVVALRNEVVAREHLSHRTRAKKGPSALDTGGRRDEEWDCHAEEGAEKAERLSDQRPREPDPDNAGEGISA